MSARLKPPLFRVPASEYPSNRAPTHDDVSLGQRIKSLRQSQGITQKEIAARIGVTGAQLHRYEAGTTRIAASRLMAIAGALGSQPEYLINGWEPRVVPSSIDTGASDSDDLVELVELFSKVSDPRRQLAMIAFARALVKPR